MKSRPPVTAVLKSQLKFSEFIPHGLAEQMLALRLAGASAVFGILKQPVRMVRAHDGPKRR
jgi:hypothetical protein